jgi:hypothetical protein
MLYIGSIPRFFNEKEPDYYDQSVHDYLISIGEEPTAYGKYGVVPKREGQSTIALRRYDKVASFTSHVDGLYDIAGDWLEKCFGKYLSGSRVLSYDEALEWLKPDKSPGLPWTAKYPFKCDYHMSDDGNFFAKYYDLLATPSYIRSLCSVSVKEELRLRTKIDAGGIRTIVSMDVNHVTAHTMLTQNMNSKLIRHHKKLPIKIGLNPFAGGFHELNEFMTKFGNFPNVLELDGVQFDGNFRKKCFDKICNFRFKMLRKSDRTDENFIRLTNLYTELSNAPMVDVDGSVYSRKVGNPSGQACTTPDNSFKNWMDVVVLWLLSTPITLHSYEYFEKTINCCIVGDDLNIEVHPSIQHIFNVNSIKKFKEDILMDYHFASDDFRYNKDCTFIGHSFVEVDIPTLGYPMLLPSIDCEKMRSSLLVYNEEKTNAHSIIRACGLRNETFACGECRQFFADYIDYMKEKHRNDIDPDIVSAFKNYLTDRELWILYSGLQPINLSA